MNKFDHGSSKMFKNTLLLGIITVSILKEYLRVLGETTQPLKSGSFSYKAQKQNYKVERKKYFERRGGKNVMVLSILLLTLFSTFVYLT